MQIKEEPNGVTALTGCFGDIWCDIADTLGLNFTVVEGYQYGGMDATGNWTGMIGMLHRNKAEIAVADFTPTQARSKVADFTVALLDTQ